MSANPLHLEAVFGLRLADIKNRKLTADETFTAQHKLLQEIDTMIAVAHGERDEQALAAWQAAREYVEKQVA
jgi:hypothetical protein